MQPECSVREERVGPELWASPGQGPCAVSLERGWAPSFWHPEEPRGFWAPVVPEPLTFYDVLPGKAPLSLRSEKQVTACVVLQAVSGKMFMMHPLGKQSRSAQAT